MFETSLQTLRTLLPKKKIFYQKLNVQRMQIGERKIQ